MGIHWDTPEFQLRSDVNDRQRDVGDRDVSEMLSAFERNNSSYDSGSEMAAIVRDLRRRVPARICSSPAPGATTAMGPHGPLLVFAPSSPAIDEDEIPW